HERASLDRGAADQAKPGPSLDARSAPLLLLDRMIDHALLGRDTADEREVDLRELTSGDRLPQDRRALLGPREEERAARAPIEPVHRVDPLADRIADERDRVVAICAPPAMDEHAGGLVDHYDLGVLKEDLHSKTKAAAASSRRSARTPWGSRSRSSRGSPR